MRHVKKEFIILLIVFVSGIAGITHAQVRNPADGPTPPPIPPCPNQLLDATCEAWGYHGNNDFAVALGTAGNICQAGLLKCTLSQSQELAGNKAACQSVPGCTLKYQIYEDECENGSWLNCNPKTDNDPANTIYYCTIEGKYDLTGYRCDRGQAGDGELVA